MEAMEIIRAYELLRSKGIDLPGLSFTSDAAVVFKAGPNPSDGNQNRKDKMDVVRKEEIQAAQDYYPLHGNTSRQFR